MGFFGRPGVRASECQKQGEAAREHRCADQASALERLGTAAAGCQATSSGTVTSS
jgi:hypothetical protein